MVPKGWRTTTVGTVCSFSSGHGFGPKDWAGSGMPIIRIQNLNGSRSFNYFEGIPDPDWIVEPGELLFAWAGVKGVSFGPTIWNGPRGLLNQHIFRVRPENNVHLQWLYAILRMITGKIEQHAHGFKSNLVHVRRSDITSQTVLLPPPNEQERIAHIVSTWDRAIELSRQLLAKTIDRRTTWAQHLLNGARRLRPGRNAWSEVHLRDVSTEQKERNAGRLGVECVKAVNKVLGLVPMRERVIGESLDRYKIVPPKAFAYNPMRLNIGSLVMSDEPRDVLVSPDYVVFTCNEGQLDPDYLNHYRRSHAWTKFVEVAGNGSVRVRIYFRDLGAMKLKLPPIEEQLRIARVLTTCDREIELLERQLEAFKAQKKGLMQKLLTGQIQTVRQSR